MGYFSMPKYFQEMPTVGKELVNVNDENAKEIKAVEADIHESIEKALAAGIRREVKRARTALRNAAYQRSH